jgi:transcriptional regulator with XRE-family HTH domain
MLSRSSGEGEVGRGVNWREIRAKKFADPAFRREFREEYPYVDVAAAVARLRVEHGLTQRQLAERIDSTQSVIARLEGGQHPVSIQLLSRIAAAFDLEWEPAFRPAGEERAEPVVASTAVTTTAVVAATPVVYHYKFGQVTLFGHLSNMLTEWPTAYEVEEEDELVVIEGTYPRTLSLQIRQLPVARSEYASTEEKVQDEPVAAYN